MCIINHYNQLSTIATKNLTTYVNELAGGLWLVKNSCGCCVNCWHILMINHKHLLLVCGHLLCPHFRTLPSCNNLNIFVKQPLLYQSLPLVVHRGFSQGIYCGHLDSCLITTVKFEIRYFHNVLKWIKLLWLCYITFYPTSTFIFRRFPPTYCHSPNQFLWRNLELM
jgi:hypothetical protein